MTVVPSVIGLLVLGDKARHGFAVVTYFGFAVAVVVIVSLTFVAAPEGTPLVGPGVIPRMRVDRVS